MSLIWDRAAPICMSKQADSRHAYYVLMYSKTIRLTIGKMIECFKIIENGSNKV